MPQSDQDSGWRGLYRIGGAAAVLAVAFFRRHLSAEVMALTQLGIVRLEPPSRAMEWFLLLQHSRLPGLVLLDLGDLVEYALVGVLFLALYGALRRANRSAMTIATACDLVGVAVNLSSNQAFAMLALSSQYVAAGTDAQRATFLAAGEALLAIHNPGGVFLSLLLVALAGLIASLVMLRSRVFGKTTATVGIVANALVLGYFVALALVPGIAFLFPPISAPFRVVWYTLIARRLFQLGRGVSEVRP